MTSAYAFDLLVVDDDAGFRGTLRSRFARHGIEVQTAGNGDEALGLAERQNFYVAIFDMMMPGMSGLELLKRFKDAHAESEVILLTGQGSIESAVEAMKLGAYDYLQKPFPLKDLETVASKAFERCNLRKENEQLKALLGRSQPPSEMIGQSPAMQEIFRLIQRAGPSDKAILILGESGTGKELVARALHRQSRRADKPMVVINCAALPESLLESELFGHEKGSFTGAVSSKPGLFQVTTAEQRRRVFEPFYTTKPTGTGLGTAIAKRLVDVHGGTIAVGNEHPEGTEIIVTIPRRARN